MTAATSTERARSLRARRERDGLKEVRGIWAPVTLHDDVRKAAREHAAKLAARKGG